MIRPDRIRVVITQRITPVIEISLAAGDTSNGFGYMRGTIAKHDDIVSPDFEAWASNES